jgi:hypothetical protein
LRNSTGHQKDDPNVVESLHRTKEMGYRVKEYLGMADWKSRAPVARTLGE